MAIKGTLFPDVSHWHPITDGGAIVRAGSPCVGIKIGQRTKDPLADQNVARAEGAGLIVIGYVFGTDRPGIDQAEDLAGWFPWKPGRIWALDNEHNSPDPADSITQPQAADVVGRLHALHPKGLWPWEYRNASTPKHGSGLQWIAEYGPSVAPSSATGAWQFYGGLVGAAPHSWPGVAGNCDMNLLTCSMAALRAAAGLDEEEDDVPQTADECAAAAWTGGRKVRSANGPRTTTWHSEKGDHQTDFERGWDYEKWLQDHNLAPPALKS